MRGFPRSSTFLILLAASVAAAQPRPGAAPDVNAVRTIAGANRFAAPDSLPSPRFAATAAVVRGQVYLFGGVSEAGAAGPRGIDEVLSFDAATGRWTEHAPLPGQRGGAGTALIGDRVYLVGGSVFPEQKISRDVLIYDPSADSWSRGPSLVHERSCAAVFATSRGIMAFEGIREDRYGTATIERLERNEWRVVGETGFPRLQGSSVEFGGKFYFFGGIDGARGHGMVRVSSSDAYDPATERWTRLAPMPTARRDAAAAVLGGKIYVVGGEDGARMGLSTVEIYDPAGGTWTTAPSLPEPRIFAAAAALSGRLYIFGGSPDGRSGTATVQVYDPDSRSWTVYGGFPTSPEPAGPSYSPPPVVRRSPPPTATTIRLARKAPERPADYALVIGVDDYKTLPRAEFAEGDAREMAAAFASLGVPDENIVTLTGAKATLSEVSKYVEEWLPKHVAKDSRVYFYFSGHGAPDVKDGSAYLMPWDADAAFVKSTGFPLKRLYAALGSLSASHVVAVFDSCFSGDGGRSVIAPGLRPLVTVRLPAGVPPRVSVLAASEKDEVAGIYPERGHGLFTYHVLQGLAGAADENGEGHVTIEKLYAYARKHVILDARRRQDREQTPTLTTADPELELY